MGVGMPQATARASLARGGGAHAGASVTCPGPIVSNSATIALVWAAILHGNATLGGLRWTARKGQAAERPDKIGRAPPAQAQGPRPGDLGRHQARDRRPV